MKESVNILCLYWVGEFRGRDFTMEDVERLHRSVSIHMDRPFKFYCLTNSQEKFSQEVTPIPLLHNFPGWWSKMEIHRPDLPITGRTLYMDLDSHAMQSLAPIFDFPKKELTMFETGIPEKKWSTLENKGWICKYQAATMLFTPGDLVMKQVWERFISQPRRWMRKYRSDQDIMGKWIPDQPVFPRNWMCKLGSIKRFKWEELPKEVIIVTGQTQDGLFRNTESIPWFENQARG